MSRRTNPAPEDNGPGAATDSTSAAVPEVEADSWYYLEGTTQSGPATSGEISDLVASGALLPGGRIHSIRRGERNGRPGRGSGQPAGLHEVTLL